MLWSGVVSTQVCAFLTNLHCCWDYKFPYIVRMLCVCIPRMPLPWVGHLREGWTLWLCNTLLVKLNLSWCQYQDAWLMHSNGSQGVFWSGGVGVFDFPCCYLVDPKLLIVTSLTDLLGWVTNRLWCGFCVFYSALAICSNLLVSRAGYLIPRYLLL